ncbi:MAG: DNA glycosylase [Chloracidobacterium sp.]
MPNDTVVLPAAFNPELTLLGGQAFRWEARLAPGGKVTYQGVVEDAVMTVAQIQGRWHVRLVNHALTTERRCWLAHYFDLDRDYAGVHATLVKRLARMPGATGLADEVAPLAGLRLLRQPWFEVLVSFVISANNHLPRIRQIINIISRKFGTPLTQDAYAFPTPAALATVPATVLRTECRVGYRDRYLHQLAQSIAGHGQFWNQAATCPTDDLRQRLIALPGVGPKVAECVLLFGFHRWEAFPIDVWVRRAMTALLAAQAPAHCRLTDRHIAEAAATHFGTLAGLAQQYLFEALRRRRHQP